MRVQEQAPFIPPPTVPPAPMFFPQTAEQLAYMQQVQQLQRLVVAQVNYYFSDENLLRDEYLRRQMDGEGWISIELLATFNRLRSLTTDLHLIGEVRALFVAAIWNTTLS